MLKKYHKGYKRKKRELRDTPSLINKTKHTIDYITTLLEKTEEEAIQTIMRPMSGRTVSKKNVIIHKLLNYRVMGINI